MEWYNWCRLCGKENGNQFNVFIKNEGLLSVADIIQRFFSIEILNTEDNSKCICILCNDYLLSLNEYANKVRKVHALFIEIESNFQIGSDIDIDKLRLKYDLEVSLTSNDKISIKSDNQEKDQEIQTNFYIENMKAKENDMINLNSTITEKTRKRKSTNDTKRLRNKIENLFSNKKDSLCGTKRINRKTRNVKSQVLIPSSNDNDSDFLNDNYSDKSWINEDSLENESCDNEKPDSKLNKNKELKKKKKRIYKTGEKNFECEECHQKFTRESDYLYHIKKNHKGLPPCKFCGKVCKTNQKLRLHLDIHLPPKERETLRYKCPNCDKKFTQSSQVKEHVRARHLQEKPFVCEQCGKNFACQSNLSSHKRTHDNQSRLNCSLCPKIFNNPHKLRFHIKHTHNSTGHACSVCGQVLKTRKTLRNHMLVHSDAKPFKCNYCGKDFKRDKNLQIHMISHSGLKPYACRFCNQSYANHSNCKKHEKHSHPIEYKAAAAIIDNEPQQLIQKKLPNIVQLEAMLEQLKGERELTVNSRLLKKRYNLKN